MIRTLANLWEEFAGETSVGAASKIERDACQAIWLNGLTTALTDLKNISGIERIVLLAEAERLMAALGERKP